MQTLFIGIDGGASKTEVRIEDSAGGVLGHAIGGPSNIRLSVEESWRSIYSAIEKALQPQNIALKNNSTHQFHVAMGLAGSEVKSARETFLQHAHPFATLQLTTDAHIACLGAHGSHDGAIIIAGTGVIGYQIEKNQNTKVGGWGFPHDDVGSGAWIGMQAVRATLKWQDKRADISPLVEDIFNFFNNDLEQLSHWANSANSSEFARIAPFVVRHSERQEKIAVNIMQNAARAIDEISAGLLKLQQEQSTPLPCALFGGISSFLKPWLSETLRARLVQGKGDAVSGAMFMARGTYESN